VSPVVDSTLNTSAAGVPPSLTDRVCGDVEIRDSTDTNSLEDNLRKSRVVIVPPNSATPMLTSPEPAPIPARGSSSSSLSSRSEPVMKEAFDCLISLAITQPSG